MREFPQFKISNASKTNIVEELDGSLRLVDKYEGFAADPDSIKQAKTPIFLKDIENTGSDLCRRRGMFFNGLQRMARYSLQSRLRGVCCS